MSQIESGRKGGRVKGRKGLAAMEPEKRLEIQRKGGAMSWTTRVRKSAA